MTTSDATVSTIGQQSAGGGRGRGRGRMRPSIGGRGQPPRARTTTFKGNTNEMNGNVFECYDEQTDRRQYAKTLEALEAHVKKTLKFAEDLAPLFGETMAEPHLAMPDDPGDNPTRAADMIYSEKVKQYVKRESSLTSNMATMHAIIWGQCSETMKARLKAMTNWKERTETNDCFWLLQQIKAVTLQFDEKRNGIMSLLDARSSLLNCRQQQGQPVNVYKEIIKGWADAIQFHGGTVAERVSAVPETDNDGVLRTAEQREGIAREETLAMLMIRGADATRYGTLLADLSNQFAMGRDEYPKTMTAAASLLTTYATPVNQRPRQPPTTPTRPAAVSSEASAMTFAQRSTMTYAQRVAASVAGTDGIIHPGISCYNCNGAGHYSDACPAPTASPSSTAGTTLTQTPTEVTMTTGTTLTQYAYMLAQSINHGIDPSWILLDSQSTMSVIKNPAYVTNVRKSGRILRALTNGGHQDSTMIAEFPNLGEVWFNTASIANILSLAAVRRVCRVTMDSSQEPALLVHRLDGSVMKFVEHASGLYVYAPPVTNTPVTTHPINYTMLSTVAGQKKLFSRREVHAADAARELYRKLGRPDEAEFQSILRQNLLHNCPVTPTDARRALTIYGPDIAVIKGKTTRSAAAPRAPTFEAVPLPPPVLTHHRNVTLCVDFFFVQGILFYHTISRGIGFRTIHQVPDRTKSVILRTTHSVIKLYQSRGFTVCDIHGDNEFECLRDDIHPIALNIVTADSHVGEIERSIRTVKERLRTCVHGLPFKRIPKLMIRHMLDDVIRCLNQFPWKHGISTTLSPAGLVLGHPAPDFNNFRLEFGTYVQVFEDNTPSNTPRARSLGAIALNPTGNAHGDYHFLSLASGFTLSRHNWTALPMTDTAIARVEALAFADDQPLIQERGFVVEWRPDHPIDDYEYDRDYEPPPDPADFLPADDDLVPLDDEELHDLHFDAAAHDFVDPAAAPAALAQGAHEDDAQQHNQWFFDNDQPALIAIDDDEQEQHDNDDAAIPIIIDDNDNNDNENVDHDNTDHQGAHNDEHNEYDNAEHEGAHDEHNEHEDADHEGAHDAPHNGPRYNLRERGAERVRFRDVMDSPHDGKSYYPPTQPTQLTQHGHDMAADMKYVYGHIMTQMTAKAGIKKHGRAAEEALMREFAQLEDLRAYESVDVQTLTREQRRGALRAINLIKEKRNGKLKGRTVADGSVQRSLYTKSETTSPTVSSDALLLTIMIDAHEQRDVATADIAGAYLKAYMDDFVIMKFTGHDVDILCELNPGHKRFVVSENGTNFLYVRLIKALYGCVKSALLWYELFVSNLQEMGFTLNPYDQCIANCMIDGKQCTIAWYVDDTKISHADHNVVSMIIDKLEERFDKMTVTRGDKHVFLGMNIAYTKQRTAEISMKCYLEEAIADCGMDITGTAKTPATRTLFEVDEGATPLDKDDADIFHSVVAKLLYVAIRARMDTLLAVSFLCTRVSKSTEQDRSKLKRLLQYIKGTLELVYTLGADDLSQYRTFVDASYAVHPDMKSHTGGTISFGIGGLVAKSTKQKLNTKSSTEAELVGASDYLPNTIWVKMFLEAQGHKIEKSYFEQDNESAIKLESNGRSSAGPRSRHIDIRFFWIKDSTKANGIDIRHCPTLQMLADFFTKPLQGALFHKFRDVLLGYKHVNSLNLAPSPELEERVGDERADGRGTDGPGIENFILVKGKKKRKLENVLCPGTERAVEECSSGTKTNKPQQHDKIVARDHSLETIQLAK